VHERRAVRVAVSLQHAETGWQRDAQVTNLGLGGACVELPPTAVDPRNPYGAVVFTGTEVSLGDTLLIGFVAPSLWDPLEVRARVAWVRARTDHRDVLRFGVAFEHADPPTVMSLFDLMTSLDYES